MSKAPRTIHAILVIIPSKIFGAVFSSRCSRYSKPLHVIVTFMSDWLLNPDVSKPARYPSLYNLEKISKGGDMFSPMSPIGSWARTYLRAAIKLLTDAGIVRLPYDRRVPLASLLSDFFLIAGVYYVFCILLT